MNISAEEMRERAPLASDNVGEMSATFKLLGVGYSTRTVDVVNGMAVTRSSAEEREQT